MAKQRLTVDIPEDLYNLFMNTVTESSGRWRSQKRWITFSNAVESAVVAALLLFLQGLGFPGDLPEFRDYVNEKYPYLDEDLVTMIEDLIKRESERITKKG